MGGFMSPPGHPDHEWSVGEYTGRTSHRELGRMSISTAAEAHWAPESVRARAQQLLAEAQIVCSELWVRHVYGYYQSMYLPESGDRTVQDLITDPAGKLPAERHAAVALVREYFPDHQPRTDLIADFRFCYGSYPCINCDQAVQYDARLDAYEVPFGDTRGCPDGGAHEWPAREKVSG